MSSQALSRWAIRCVLVGGAGLALATPSALARPRTDTHSRTAVAVTDTSARPSIGVVPPDLRNPDLREGHNSAVPYSPAAGQYPPAPAPRILTTSAAGFDWPSAAIGGGVLACLCALLALAAAAFTRHGRARAAG